MYGCYDATTDLVVATNAIPDYRAQEVKGDVTLYPPSIIGKLRGRVSTTAFKNILSIVHICLSVNVETMQGLLNVMITVVLKFWKSFFVSSIKKKIACLLIDKQ